LWAIEDRRHMTRRLERDPIAAGESVVRVPPKLMAHVRDSARSYGKSYPIDSLRRAGAAVAVGVQRHRTALQLRRHLLTPFERRREMADRFAVWNQVTGVAAAA
jgi:transposase